MESKVRDDLLEKIESRRNHLIFSKNLKKELDDFFDFIREEITSFGDKCEKEVGDQMGALKAKRDEMAKNPRVSPVELASILSDILEQNSDIELRVAFQKLFEVFYNWKYVASLGDGRDGADGNTTREIKEINRENILYALKQV